mmetsp:Transcript_22301/g.66076  ORF Transcript_22301/g.66076 Transcript_22301/m.66076 type:complete len:208 (+) Transcript_22301:382-1005(+)
MGTRTADASAVIAAARIEAFLRSGGDGAGGSERRSRPRRPSCLCGGPTSYSFPPSRAGETVASGWRPHASRRLRRLLRRRSYGPRGLPAGDLRDRRRRERLRDRTSRNGGCAIPSDLERKTEAAAPRQSEWESEGVRRPLRRSERSGRKRRESPPPPARARLASTRPPSPRVLAVASPWGYFSDEREAGPTSFSFVPRARGKTRRGA